MSVKSTHVMLSATEVPSVDRSTLQSHWCLHCRQ